MGAVIGNDYGHSRNCPVAYPQGDVQCQTCGHVFAGVELRQANFIMVGFEKDKYKTSCVVCDREGSYGKEEGEEGESEA